MEIVVDASGSVCEYGCVAAQKLCYTDWEDNLLHGVALIEVKATLDAAENIGRMLLNGAVRWAKKIVTKEIIKSSLSCSIHPRVTA